VNINYFIVICVYYRGGAEIAGLPKICLSASLPTRAQCKVVRQLYINSVHPAKP